MNRRHPPSNSNDRPVGSNTDNRSMNPSSSLSTRKKKIWSLDVTFIVTVMIVIVTFGFVGFSGTSLDDDHADLDVDVDVHVGVGDGGVGAGGGISTRELGPKVPSIRGTGKVQFVQQPQQQRQIMVRPRAGQNNNLNHNGDNGEQILSPPVPTGTKPFVDSDKCNNRKGHCQVYFPFTDLEKSYRQQLRIEKTKVVPDMLLAEQQQQNKNITDALRTLPMILTRQGMGFSHEVNQDRSFVIYPFLTGQQQQQQQNEKDYDVTKENNEEEEDFIMGIFDGHGDHGQYTAHYAVTNLPRLLSTNLDEKQQQKQQQQEDNQKEKEEDIIKQALIESFHQLDSDLDKKATRLGGSTASFTYRHSNKLYIANIGDSFTFVVTYNPSTEQSKIIYKTREDKPELPEERKRIEEKGGEVMLPPPHLRDVDSSRVKKKDDPTSIGNDLIYALAMSRSFGDGEMKDIGVISTPAVDVVDIDNARKGEKGEEELQVFVIAATDGLFQQITHEDALHKVVSTISKSNAGGDGGEKPGLRKQSTDPLVVFEELILQASKNWSELQEMIGAYYRDDMTLAAMRVI